MEKRSLLSTYTEGNSPTRLIQGLVVGILGTVVIGFTLGGWEFGSSVDLKVVEADRSATVAALAPICAARYKAAAATDGTMVPELAALRSWERDTLLMKAGWATFPGGDKPNSYVAESCADMISKNFDLKN